MVQCDIYLEMAMQIIANFDVFLDGLGKYPEEYLGRRRTEVRGLCTTHGLKCKFNVKIITAYQRLYRI